MKVKEVPPSKAAEFLQDVDKDPKFLRWQQREEFSATASALRSEIALLRLPSPRAWMATLRVTLLALLFTAPLPQFWMRAVVAAFCLAAVVVEDMHANKKERARLDRLAQVQSALTGCESRIQEIDAAMSASVKIVDPDDWGKQPEAKQLPAKEPARA